LGDTFKPPIFGEPLARKNGKRNPCIGARNNSQEGYPNGVRPLKPQRGEPRGKIPGAIKGNTREINVEINAPDVTTYDKPKYGKWL